MLLLGSGFNQGTRVAAVWLLPTPQGCSHACWIVAASCSFTLGQMSPSTQGLPDQVFSAVVAHVYSQDTSRCARTHVCLLAAQRNAIGVSHCQSLMVQLADDDVWGGKSIRPLLEYQTLTGFCLHAFISYLHRHIPCTHFTKECHP